MARVANDNYDDDFVDYRDEEGGGGRSFAEQLDLQHYLRILRKHKWPITLFTAAVTSLAAYYAFTATPVYSASSTLLIEQQNANVVSVEDLYGVETENADYYQTQFELLKSRGLAKRVIERLDMWDNPELSPFARDAEARKDSAQADAIGEPDEDEKEESVVGNILAMIGLGGGSKGDEMTVPTADVLPPPSDPVDRNESSVMESNGLPGQRPSLADMPGANQQIMSFDVDDEEGGERGVVQTQKEREQELVINAFMQKMSISPVRKTKLVNISYESEDPILAARVANTVGEQYITSYLDAKLEMTTKASQWLNIRLTDLKKTLDESEDRLLAFKQENNLVDVDGSVGRLNEQELLLATTELAAARSELASTADLNRAIESANGDQDVLQSIPAVQSDGLVQGVKIEQGQAQRQLDELSNRYGARHPRVVDAQSQLNTLNNTLERNVNRVVSGIQRDYQLQQQRVATIQSKLSAGKENIQSLGDKTFELKSLERELATNQEIYDTFFNRISEARSADGLETANARVSDFAVAPINPVKPKKQLIIALAALASLVLSMLMAFLYEQMDDTIKSTNDIEGKLGMKLLGILPMIKSGLFRKNTELPLNPSEIPDKKGTFTEAVNTVRTALCMNEGDRQRKVIVVTSSVPGEGKSTAAINLAYSLAQLERVLLIDCDLRRPTVAKAAGLDKSVSGLSNLITNTAPARECIRRGVFEGSVDILPSGPIPDQPLELLSSRRFEKIIEQLSQHYDRIVIDSAPTQAVSDALVLSKLCDALVYVVKSHDTSIDLVKRGIQRLEQVKAPIAGVLITQVDIDKITSYGGDYYYQGYYDYYGYTEKGATKRPGKLRLSQEELISIKTDESDVNLDLDYGMNGRGATARPRPMNSRVNKRSASAGDFDSPDNYADEFDMTTQIEAPPDRESRQRSIDSRQRQRYSDDLDII